MTGPGYLRAWGRGVWFLLTTLTDTVAGLVLGWPARLSKAHTMVFGADGERADSLLGSLYDALDAG